MLLKLAASLSPSCLCLGVRVSSSGQGSGDSMPVLQHLQPCVYLLLLTGRRGSFYLHTRKMQFTSSARQTQESSWLSASISMTNAWLSDTFSMCSEATYCRKKGHSVHASVACWFLSVWFCSMCETDDRRPTTQQRHRCTN